MWVSGALPGSVHDLKTAWIWGILRALRSAGLSVPADKGYSGEGWPVLTPYKGRGRPEAQKEANRSHARLRGPAERATAQLKTWHVLRHLRCCPHRAGRITKAVCPTDPRDPCLLKKGSVDMALMLITGCANSPEDGEAPDSWVACHGPPIHPETSHAVPLRLPAAIGPPPDYLTGVFSRHRNHNRPPHNTPTHNTHKNPTTQNQNNPPQQPTNTHQHQHSKNNHPNTKKGAPPQRQNPFFLNMSPAASYSPTQSPMQYHRRWKA